MIEERLEALAGSPVSSLERIQGGGYSAAGRYLVTFSDGERAFAKVAANDDTAEWLQTEHVVYSQVEASFLPRFLGYDESDPPILLLEDLSDGHWPPPWPDGSIDAVRSALGRIAAVEPPEGVPSVEIYRELTTRWRIVEEDPGPFLSLGLCSPEWLAAVLPTLRSAAESAPIEGDALLHLDVRSDNICLADGRAVLVDWNWACVGNPLFDLAAWLPSLHLEGGPEPDELLPDGAEGFASLLAGFWGASAALPPPPGALPRVRDLQRAQLEVALPWAVRALGLPSLG